MTPTFKMTHVVRGDDHLPNTPRQMQIFYALRVAIAGICSPADGDVVPMGRNSRNGTAPPRSLLSRVGLFSRSIAELFGCGWAGRMVIRKSSPNRRWSTTSISPTAANSAGIFNAEKLLWLNFHYLKQRSVEQLAREVRRLLSSADGKFGRSEVVGEDGRNLTRASQDAGRIGRFRQLYLNDEIQLDPKATAKFLNRKSPSRSKHWRLNSNTSIATLMNQQFRRALSALLSRFNMKLGQLAQPVRVALTGGTVSPGIYEVIAVLGRERTVRRLREAIARIT